MQRGVNLRGGTTVLVGVALFLILPCGQQAATRTAGAGTRQTPRQEASETSPVSSLAAPQGPTFLVPDDVAELNGSNAIPVHDYGSQRLVVVPQAERLPQALRRRLTAVDDPSTITFRSWRGQVTPVAQASLSDLAEGYYLLSLVGPEDPTWRRQLEVFGVSTVDTAWPYGLVVHANGVQLLAASNAVMTSYGYSVIRGIAPVPIETRVSGELWRVIQGKQTLADIAGLRRDAQGRAVVRLFYFSDLTGEQRPLDHRAAQLAEVKKCARIPGSAIAYGFDDAVLIAGPEELLRILREVPSVAYVEALHERQTDDHAQVYYPVAMAVSPPLYKVRPIVPETSVQPKLMPEEEIPSWVNGKNQAGASPETISGESVLQEWVGAPAMPSPIKNFEGLGSGLSGFSMTGAPPDTEGDVGPNDYVQWVNSMFAVFDKSTGSVLYGPANGNTLFSPLGGRCASDNNGDPLVMYDRIADRWFMSQFSVSASPYYQCVAVSQTGDPVTSAWNLYAYSYGSNFNDYGKSGLWPDGYYIMYHMFANGSSWAGTEVCAFDRVKMLAGQVATQQCFGPNASYGGLLPSHLQGDTLPPSGSPNYFMAYGTNQLLFWPFHVDWTTPTSTTFPFNSPTTLSVASFTEACGGSGGTCVPQKGTTNTLDTLGDRLMWRMNYRNFGTYESLVLNHTVTGGAGTGVRWYEIRNLSTTPTVYQQGTYAPADTTWRWMGSIDMDKNGDIAAGYSASSSTMNPSIWYTGRLVTDALGTFGQGEATLYSGTGSQTGSLTRWGDYSTMSIDPTDDCTFWYTSEYLTANGTFNWHTRIGSFKFASCTTCTTPGTPTIGTVTVPGTNQLTVSWSAGSPAGSTYNIYRSTGACPGGAYALVKSGQASSPWTDSTVSGGTTYAYEVTAVDSTGKCESAKSGCASATATGTCTATPSFAGVTSVTNPGNAVCTLVLGWAAGSSNCSGSVSYNVYRSTSSSFTPSVSNKIATGVSGTGYTDTDALAYGSSYYYIVRAVDSANGLEDANTVTLGAVPTGPTTTTSWTDTFEGSQSGGGFDLSGWSHTAVNGSTNWAWSTARFHDGSHSWFGQDIASTSDMVLVSPAFGVGASTTMSFYHTYGFEGSTSQCYDGGTLEYSTNAGVTWTVVPDADFTAGGFTGTINSSYSNPIAGKRAWCAGTVGSLTQVTVNLGGDSNLLNKTVQMRWHEGNDSSVSSTGWYVDTVTVNNAQTSGTCTTGAAGPPGVPNGLTGTAMTATKTAADGSAMTVDWDASCSGTQYEIVYGTDTTLPVSYTGTYGLSGVQCSIGNSGAYGWNSVPPVPGGAKFLWWLVVATDGGTTEGAWGKNTSQERTGPGASGSSQGASGACATTKSLANTCGQ